MPIARNGFSVSVITDPAQSCLGPRSVFRSNLNSDGAGDRVVTTGKTAHADHVLNCLAFDDIPDVFGVQGCLRQGDQHDIASPKHSYELVGQ
jgi:hypothetical protein